MDYEIMMNGNVRIGEKAIEFEAQTTMGKIKLSDYKEKWVILFSHPGDFTPVCTTEIIAFAKAYSYFKSMNAELIGLSVDSNNSHLAWVYDIYKKTGITIPFPIIADLNGEIARKYGMIANKISNTATVRDVFIIDDKGIIRLILSYPMNIGRNIAEILRALNALQIAETNNQMAPANWVPCDPMIVPAPNNFEGLQKRVSDIEQEDNGMSWYLSFKKPEKCEIGAVPSLNQIVQNTQNYDREENKRTDMLKESKANEKIKNEGRNNSEIMNNNMRNIRRNTIQWKNFR